MQHARRRVEGEILVGRDARVHPAVGSGPLEEQHVVGEVATEDELIVGKGGFGSGGFGDGEGGGVDFAEAWVGGIRRLKGLRWWWRVDAVLSS